MVVSKANKYSDFFIKTEKFKTKLRFKLFCSNLNMNRLLQIHIQADSNFTANFSHSYKGIKIRCTISMPKESLERFLSGEGFSKVKVYKGGNNFRFMFVADYKDYPKYLDMRYTEIPQQITILRQYESKCLKAKATIEVVCEKKAYSVLVGYHDKSLPKTMKRERQTLVHYTGLSKAPLRAGGFSPR